MPISRGPLPPAEEVLRLFRRGHGTLEIASMFYIREADAYRLLHAARDNERKMNAQNNSTVTAIGEQTLAHNKDRRDVSITKVQCVANVGDLAAHGASETSTDQRPIQTDIARGPAGSQAS